MNHNMEPLYTDERGVQIVISLLKQHGISYAVVSPGTCNIDVSRSLQIDPFFKVFSAPDERSAAYMACGISQAKGEPVILSCTGATASRNYLPGITEAHYRKLPVLAITSTQPTSRIGHLVPQVIDRLTPLRDTYLCNENIGVIKDNEDERDAEIKTNRAILALTRGGGGPAQINLATSGKYNFNTKELPKARKISRYNHTNSLPEIVGEKIGIYVGAHTPMSKVLTDSIEKFCASHGAVALCDHTSNYCGKYKVNPTLVYTQDNYSSKNRHFDLIIHIGEVSGAYAYPFAENVWRVSEDGELRDTFGKLSAVFEMSESAFFDFYAGDDVKENVLLKLFEEEEALLRSRIPYALPFSAQYIAKTASYRLPTGSVLHLGILNSLRSWDNFYIDDSIRCFSNVGGFGIDGPLSTAMGCALAQSDKLHFLVVGDLAFFYDLNAVFNRHFPANLRILLVNNGNGTEFKNYNNPAAPLGEEANEFISAAGHNGSKSRSLVKNMVENLEWKYLTASDGKEFEEALPRFLTSAPHEKPIILEVFTRSEDESEALRIMRNLMPDKKPDLAHKVANIVLNDKGKNIVKKIIGR